MFDDDDDDDDRSPLRASSSSNLVMLWTRQCIGDTAFSVAAPRA